ncbi:MAG: hypothetical protein EBR93_04685, partial [Bacteroidetes bacterium]|nr:hypothetical protein [Bacteroidota bacterium]
MWGKHAKQIGNKMIKDDTETKFLPLCPVRASWGQDQTLLANVSKYRAGKFGFDLDDTGKPLLPYDYDNEVIIPKCRAFFDLTRTGEDNIVTDDNGADNDQSMTELIDMWLQKEIVKGLDSNGMTVNFAVDLLIIRAVSVGTEPLLALYQISKNIPSVADSTLKVFSHMSRTLQLSSSNGLGLKDYFSSYQPFSAPRISIEAQVPLAVFQFANDHDLTRVHYGGFRMDVSIDSLDMQYYKEYIGLVEDNRVAHFNLVSSYATQLYVDAKGYRRHVCIDYQLDSWPGVCYWKMSLSELDEQLEAIAPEDRVGETWQNILDWRMYKLLHDTEWAYIPDEHGTHRTAGCKVKINNDAFAPWINSKRKQEKDVESLVDLDPIRVCPMWKLYIETRLKEFDPMCSFFEPDCIATVDLCQLRSLNLSQMRPEMIDFMNVMHGFMWEKPMDMLDANTLRENDLRKLFGIMQPEFTSGIDNLWANVSMNEVFTLQSNLIDSHLQSALNLMSNGELEQWKYLAKTIRSVEANKHGDFAQMFVTENEIREEVLRSRVVNEHCHHLPLDETQMAAMTVTEYSEKKLDLNLYRQNMWTYKTLCYSLMATFSYKRGYGFPVKVGDMAHDITVIDMGGRVPVEINWNIKTPGAGLDTIL